MTKKSAFTIIELIITMVLAGILITAMTCQFIALVRFNTMTTRNADDTTRETPLAVREARVVISSLTNVLRFATDVAFDPATNKLTVTVERGCIDLVPLKAGYTTGEVIYTLTAPELTLTNNAVTPPVSGAVLSKNVRPPDAPTLWASWDPGTRETTIKLIFFDDNITLPVETTVKALT